MFLEHASFAKLREVALSYDLGQRLTEMMFRGMAKNATVSITGQNLFTKTNYRGLDPEVSNFGDVSAEPYAGLGAVSAEPPVHVHRPRQLLTATRPTHAKTHHRADRRARGLQCLC